MIPTGITVQAPTGEQDLCETGSIVPRLRSEKYTGRVIATPYEDLLRRVLDEGTQKSDRTGTGTRSLFGAQLRYDLAEGFPLITTKEVHFKSVAYELLWFLRGDSNVDWLQQHGVKIWNEWASDTGVRVRPHVSFSVRPDV